MTTRVLTMFTLLTLVPSVGRTQQGTFPVPADMPADIKARVEALRSPDPNARQDALNALALLKERAAPAVPYVADLLGNESLPHYVGTRGPISIGRRAAFTLAAIGKPAVAPAAAVLKGGPEAARSDAWEALARIDDESVAAPLAAALRDEDPKVQQAAKFAIFGFGSNRKMDHFPIQPFLEVFKNGNAFARQVALQVVGKIQRDRAPDKDAVEAVFQGLNDSDAVVRDAALRELAAGRKWIHDNRSIEPLLGALGHKDYGIRCDAATSLGRYKDRRAVPLLIAQLKDQDGNNARATAAYALGEIGDASAVEALCARLKEEPVNYVRDEAASALSKIGSPRALEALFQTIRDPDRSLRHWNVTAIEKITGHRFDQHPLWQKLLDDEKRRGGGR